MSSLGYTRVQANTKNHRAPRRDLAPSAWSGSEPRLSQRLIVDSELHLLLQHAVLHHQPPSTRGDAVHLDRRLRNIQLHARLRRTVP